VQCFPGVWGGPLLPIGCGRPPWCPLVSGFVTHQRQPADPASRHHPVRKRYLRAGNGTWTTTAIPALGPCLNVVFTRNPARRTWPWAWLPGRAEPRTGPHPLRRLRPGGGTLRLLTAPANLIASSNSYTTHANHHPRGSPSGPGRPAPAIQVQPLNRKTTTAYISCPSGGKPP